MLTVTGKGITIKGVELRYTPTGKAIATTTVVNQEEYNGKKTGHFTNLVLFGKVAEKFANEISKGCLIEILSGILKHPINEHKGKKYYNTEVVVFEYKLIEDFNLRDKDLKEVETGDTPF
jgi:single-strand DNA-binding protein